MKLHPKLTKAGVELVKRFEGLRPKAARLPDGGWTIGYGHTLSAREGVEVSATDAEALLLFDLSRVAAVVDELVFTPLNPNQFAAVVAFAFNIGLENFSRSNVLKRLNEGAFLQAAGALELWRRADLNGDSLVVDALVRRRAAEKTLFLTPVEGFKPAPSALVKPVFDPALTDLAPLLAGLTNVSDVTVSMEGEVASVEISPAADAARRVVQRLEGLFPDEAPPPPPPAAFETSAPPSPERQAEPLQKPEVAPVEDLSVAAGLDAATEAPPPPPEEVAPSLFSAPPSGGYQPTYASYAAPFQDEVAEPPVERFGRRYPTLAERAAAAQPAIEPTPPPKLAILVSGVFGAVLFCGALASMVLGKATVLNLVLGILGIVCMAPCGVHLLNRLFTGTLPADEA